MCQCFAEHIIWRRRLSSIRAFSCMDGWMQIITDSVFSKYYCDNYRTVLLTPLAGTLNIEPRRRVHITERTLQHLDGVFTVTPHLANTFLVEEAGQDSASLAVPSHAHMVHHRSQPHSSMSLLWDKPSCDDH